MIMADRDPIHLAAADWLMRLRSRDVSLEETLAWQNWVGADPRHAQAFARIEEITEVLRAVPCPPRPRPAAAARDSYDASVALREWREPRARRRVIAIAASLAGLLLAGTWASTARAPLSWSGNESVLQTAVGENRTVTLGDGSSVVLGGNTRIEVSLDEKLRAIDLVHGEAYFVVAKDHSRPFKVRAGDATVVALGTEFNVRRGADRVVVAVVEGRVSVEPTPRILPIVLLSTDHAPIRLTAGQQTTVNGLHVGAALRLPDPKAPTAWQSGRLSFRMQPLGYVLEDVNRYAPKPITIEDEAIGNLGVTGTVMADNVSGWIASLENAFDLQAVEEPDRIVLRSR